MTTDQPVTPSSTTSKPEAADLERRASPGSQVGAPTTDQPTTPRADDDLDAFRRIPLIDKLDVMRRRVAGEREPEQATAELVGGPMLDADQQLRVEALQAAAHWRVGYSGEWQPSDVVEAARAFEAYLRGDR